MIRAIRIASALIALIGAAVSYATQRALCAGPWRMDSLSAFAVPLTVDLLGIIAALALHAPNANGKRLAAWVLGGVGAVSITANALAGTTPGARIAHVWTVLAYLGAEAIAARVTAHRAAPVAEPAPFVWAEPAERTFQLDNTDATFTPSYREDSALAAPALAAEDSDRATRTYRRQSDTLALAEEIRATEPEITHDELAARLELSPKRLRAVLAGQAA